METDLQENSRGIDGPKPAKLAAGVQFRTAGKIYTFVTTDPSLARGEVVAVEGEQGTSLGTVASQPKEVQQEALPKNVKRILHRATPNELEEECKRREKALDHSVTCEEKIREHGLPMKLLDVDITDGGKRIIFSFFAEQRVDFRSLVKDLANALHMRIEMRQIGARDESKYLGCLGPCGLMTCCSLHLRQFQSISISMAKHQGLTPNPAKLTGMCGKLKCCLAYEQAVYDECRHGLPKAGIAVETPRGAGKIIGHNVLKRECVVRLYGSGNEVRYPPHLCKPIDAKAREEALAKAKQAQAEGEDSMQGRRSQTSKGKERSKRQRSAEKRGRRHGF